MAKEISAGPYAEHRHGCFGVRNSIAPNQPVEILIYEQIGQDWFGDSGVNAKDFATALAEIQKDQQIIVAINSPGGNVWDGLAIYHQLEARKQYVTTRVDGIAASIASVIAMAGRETQMPKNALLMIHDPSAIVMGNAADMRMMAGRLDQLAGNLADIYARKSGQPTAVIRAAMQAETFYTGTEAAAIGLADTVLADAQIAAHFDLSAFQRLLATLKEKTKTSAAQNGGASNTTKMKAKLLAMLREHGFKPKDEDSVETLIAMAGKAVGEGIIAEAEYDSFIDEFVEPNRKARKVAIREAGKQSGDEEMENIVALRQSVENLKAANDAERKLRIKSEITALANEGHLPLNSVDGWTARAMKDETILDEIKKLPKYQPGVDPIFNVITNEGNELVEKYRKMKPGAARAAFRDENDADLRQHSKEIVATIGSNRPLFFDPRNANTLAAALTPDYVADGLIINARNRLAPLSAFSRNFGISPVAPRASLEVPRATVGATAQTNPTNWESGDTTLAALQVPVNQISTSFHLTNDQINKGHLLSNLAGINADQFCDAISDVWTALLLAATYGTPVAYNGSNLGGIIGVATSFGTEDVPQLFAMSKNFRKRNLILDGAYIGYLMPGVSVNAGNAGIGVNQAGQSTYFGAVLGMDGIWMQSRWTAAIANSVGFLCGPDAIAVAAGLPLSSATPTSEFISQQVVNIDLAGSNNPALGLSAQINMWYSRATRTIWCSYDAMFGALAGDASTTLGQGRLLTSA